MGGESFTVTMRIDIPDYLPAWTPEKLAREIRGSVDRKHSATNVSDIDIQTAADTTALPDGGTTDEYADDTAERNGVHVTYTNVNGKERHARSRVAYISDHWVHLPDRDLLLPTHRVVAIDPSDGAVRDLWLPLSGPNPDDTDERVADYYEDDDGGDD